MCIDIYTDRIIILIMLHTKQLAKRIIGQLECRANAHFTLIGSVAANGSSEHDIDLLWDDTTPDVDYEQFALILGDMGFECAGNNDHGETWVRTDGVMIDFWFENADWSGEKMTKWRVVKRRATGAFTPTSGNTLRVLAVDMGDDVWTPKPLSTGGFTEKQLANAHIIAAAPELIAALENLIAAYRRNVPALMSTDATWAPVLDAESALSKTRIGSASVS